MARESLVLAYRLMVGAQAPRQFNPERVGPCNLRMHMG